MWTDQPVRNEILRCRSWYLLYGLNKIFKTVIGVSKITVRYSFSCPVSHFFRNFAVSFMVLYGFLEISKSVIDIAKIAVRYSFCPVSHFFRNFEVPSMVLYGFLSISKSVRGDTIRSSFSCPVFRFFRNFEVSYMVLYGFLEISKSLIGIAKPTIRSSPALSPTSFEILRCRSWYSMAFWKSSRL